MYWIVFLVLTLLWVAAMIGGYTLSAFLTLFLIGVRVLLIRLLQGHKPVT